MNFRFISLGICAIFMGTVMSFAQAEKSSGSVKLNMSKKKEVNQPVIRKEVEEGSGVVNLDMKKNFNATQSSLTPAIAPVTGAGGVNWISPAFDQVKTSEGSYRIQANVQSPEQIRVVNFFMNGNFYKNYIPSGQVRNQLMVDEMMDMNLGINSLRIEAITASNKKVEGIVTIDFAPKFYALIIGVQDYQDPEIKDLNEPIKDAGRFYRVITSKYTFDEENVFYLKNPTKAEIFGKLTLMRSMVQPSDNLLIFYAGHGFLDEEMGTGYWFPSDAALDNPVNWLPNTDLANYLKVLNAKHTLLIADACFSGYLLNRSMSTTAVENLYKIPSRNAITSGSEGQEVPDQSVFMKYLIDQLEENKDTYLSADMLFKNLKTAVVNNGSTVPLYGPIKNVGDEGGDFIFIHR